MSRHLDAIRAFGRLRALVIGDAMLDTYLEGRAERLCTEGPVPVVQSAGLVQAPGGAGNTALNVAALGARVEFLTLVGSDSTAETLRACLREARIPDASVVADAEAATVHKLRILANDQYVVRFDEGRPDQWSSHSHSELLEKLEETYDSCDLIVVSDYGYGTVSELLLDRLSDLRREDPKPLFVDSKDLRRFRRTKPTLITPNHGEAYVAVERHLPHHGEPSIDHIGTLARRLMTLVGSEFVAVTLADKGVFLLEQDGSSHLLPAFPVAHANDVGAGDTFTSGTALAMASGASLRDSAQIGLVCARIAVGKRRTAVVTQQELLQSVSSLEPPDMPSLHELVGTLQRERAQGRTVVFTNGVFDILHAGHVAFLRQAKQLGHTLVVGINTDESARRLKGKNRPINRETDRLALVRELDSVDHAILFDQDDPSALIRALRPAIHVKGGDYADEELPEASAVEEVGGRIEIIPLAGNLSTSGVIDRIVELELSGSKRAGSRL